ncbi:MAG: hypothetical protein QMC09_00345, partial [Thauera sp.]
MQHLQRREPPAALAPGGLEGFEAERHAVPDSQVRDYGMQTITNLIVRRPNGSGGKTIALNAH